jgi:hypothetical protein
MTETAKRESKIPSKTTIYFTIAMLGMGVGAFFVFMPEQKSWLAGALFGFIFSGVMGISGFWGVRKAYLAKSQAAFLKIVFLFMFLRLIAAGIAAGLVIGLQLLHVVGFVLGLFGGIMLFQAIEIAGVLTALRPSPVEEN